MKKTLLVSAIVILALSACENNPKFTIKGNITDASGKMLYLESTDIGGIEDIDSVKLSGDGSFRFKQKGLLSPDFYCLRIEDKLINISIDSTETVTIKADFTRLPLEYEVNGSENCSKIKQLTQLQLNLESNVQKIANNKSLAPGEIQDSVRRMIDSYKYKVKRQYIFLNPASAYSYFALFQKINNYLIFNPLTDSEDIKCFAAVATSWDMKYPHSDRAINLHNIAIRGMKNTRQPVTKTVEVKGGIQETGLIDIALKDLNGNTRRLSELKGKVVLLDFTVYGNAASPSRNIALNELYSKYKNKGFEIYQISLDGDDHYWKTVADNLPWICVRDKNGIYSANVGLYNVQKLPTFFLINRSNELKMRSENIKDIEKEVLKLL